MRRSLVVSIMFFVLLVASQPAQAAASGESIPTVAGSGVFCQITGTMCQFEIAPPCGDGGQPERERKRHPARAGHDRASGRTAPSGTAWNTVKLIRIPASRVRIAIGRPRCM
jgi:hypothetical protein